MPTPEELIGRSTCYELEAAGYRIVGPEMTEEMIDAHWAVWSTTGSMSDAYRAMIAAAPKWGGE